MIIFDLDGTLADCEHRRHFVRRTKTWVHEGNHFGKEFEGCYGYQMLDDNGKISVPDWKSFYEACDQDKPIVPVIEILDGIYQNTINFWEEVQIWSGRCESVREKTVKWLEENILWDGLGSHIKLKMRSIGDYTPDDELKERWLDEYIASMWPKLEPASEEKEGKIFHRKNPIEFVFDDRPKVVRMWRRRGIFVFNCCQNEEEF